MIFFEPIVLILLMLIILILLKILTIENQQYQHLMRELKQFSKTLELFNHRLNKLSKLLSSHPPESETSSRQEISESSVESPGVVKEEHLVLETTHVPPESPTPKTSMLLTARETLKSLWSWIIVGEEYRVKNVSMEYAIATTWLLRFGVVAILFAIGYFLNYSIAKGYFVPPIRVMISLLIGLGMLIGGLKLLRGAYHLIGQGLMGGGLAVLYFSLYAATIMYQLISLPEAFAAMILVTIIASVLAIWVDSSLLAILSIIGGYTTPIMLGVGQPNIIILYSYMFLLGLGIFSIAHYKQWRLLNYLAFAFNYTIFIGSLLNYQQVDFPIVLTFLTLFFILHSSLVYIYNIVQEEKSTLLEIGQLIINAILYTLTAYKLIKDTYDHSYPALLSLGLSLFYASHAYLFLRHRPVDRGLIISLIALAGFYMTWSMPLLFEKETLTLSWSLQAFLFLWGGFKLRSNFIKNFAYLIYLIICLRLLYSDIPRHFSLQPDIVSFEYYLSTLSERLWTFGVAIASVIGAFFLLNQPIHPFKTLHMDPRNDTPHTVATNFLEKAFFWIGLFFLFLYLNLECNTLFSYYEPLRLPMLTLLWCGMVVYFLHRYLTTQDLLMLRVLLLFLSATFIKLFLLDILSWHISNRFIFDIPYNTFNVLVRAFDFGVVMGVIYACWRLLKIKSSHPVPTSFFGLMGLALLFIFMSLETNNLLYWKLPDFQTSGISILWAMFAITYIAGGIGYSIQTLRYTGLFLFFVVVGKIFFIDLAHTQTLYRVIVFLFIGLIFLVGSFVYIYSRPKFEKSIP